MSGITVSRRRKTARPVTGAGGLQRYLFDGDDYAPPTAVLVLMTIAIAAQCIVATVIPWMLGIPYRL